jgi:integrase
MPKPAKPRPDFPLFAHNSGQWAKKIRGRTHYFGVWSDATAALERYIRERDDLYAGREPRRDGQLSVADGCNHYLHAKRLQADAGTITDRTWSEYRETCRRIVAQFGEGAAIESLRPGDFEAFRASLAKRYGPTRLTNEIVRVRSVFKYLEEADHIDCAPKFGPLFRGATAKERRRLRNSKPPRMWGAEEIRRMIAAAKLPMRAWLLLGINCGFAPHDIAAVTRSAIDLDAGWVRFPRPKTEVGRTCPLWPETIEALRQSLAKLPSGGKPGAPIFATRTGRPLVGHKLDAVGQRFRRLLASLDIASPGVGFYGLRHTFQTIGEGAKDPVAVRWIMGHAADAGDMASVYRESIDPGRLVSVTDHVRNWLGFA